MSRPKYKTLWLAEKRRADGLQHKLKRWEALIPAFEERGAEVIQRFQREKSEAKLFNKICLGHKVTRLDFEAVTWAFRPHARVGGLNEDDLLSHHGFIRMSFEGVPIGLIK